MTFNERVSDLKNHVGGRNAMLMQTVLSGFSEGLSPSQVADAFSSADTGSPPLSAAEIERAISRAKEYACGDSGTTEVRFRVKMKQIDRVRDGTSPDERSFVSRMIGVGERDCGGDDCVSAQRLLVSLTPRRFAGTSRERRAKMARAFLESVFPEGGLVFATDNIRAPRDRSRIYSPRELAERIERVGSVPEAVEYYTRGTDRAPFAIPTHVGTNVYTGEPKKSNGRESYATKGSIARRNHALIEFDTMQMREQCLFWYGVIRTGELPLLSLVHSGAKSLHGVVEVREMTHGDGLFADVVTEEAKEQQWDREIRKLWRLCCSSEDIDMRCDAACKDATRMTRFPGGLRDGHSVQSLIWWKE